MKTPRDLLLERHSDADPALDRIRRRVVRQLERPTTAPPAFWRTLFGPERWQWAGLAAAWLLVAGLSLSAPASPDPGAARTQAPPGELMASLRERQRQCREWTDPAPLPENPPASGRQSRKEPPFYNV